MSEQLDQKWLTGTPMADLPDGAEEKIRERMQMWAYIIRGAVQALESTHRQVCESHRVLRDAMKTNPDERARHLFNGAAQAYAVSGEALINIRDWVVGRVG